MSEQPSPSARPSSPELDPAVAARLKRDADGLVAAITMARAGRQVTVLEAAATPGGGCRTAELTLPGFRHDVCATVLPMGLGSPALRELPLAEHPGCCKGLVLARTPIDRALAVGGRVIAVREPDGIPVLFEVSLFRFRAEPSWIEARAVNE